MGPHELLITMGMLRQSFIGYVERHGVRSEPPSDPSTRGAVVRQVVEHLD